MSEPVIAIAGNPNSGKTTLFNRLTGTRQHTGNWPGVTVERKFGTVGWKGDTWTVVDLPGIYSLTAGSEDERIARDFLMSGQASLVVIVVDVTMLERTLYLAVQCLEAGIPLMIAVSKMDRAAGEGIVLDCERLAGILGIPVVPVSASTGRGIDQLLDRAGEALRSGGQVSGFAVRYGPEFDEQIDRIEKRLSDISLPVPPRWAAIQFIEDDPDTIEMIQRAEGAGDLRREWLRSAIRLCRRLGYDDLPTLMAEKRYGTIHGIVQECIRVSSAKRRIDWTRRCDRVLTHPFVGMPLFFLILWFLFQMVFSLGDPPAAVLDRGFTGLAVTTRLLFESWSFPPLLTSLLTGAVFPGVGSVLVFLPNIMILFFLIALLEDSGYMARAAFIMDRVMHVLGLHGKSFLPMILGFGCNVPAVMGARILESKKDRVLTILILPLMSCSARLPIYILFTGIFFRRHQGLVVFSLYLVGVILAAIGARFFRGIFFRDETAPLVMELPPYRVPSMRGAFYRMWMRGKIFLRKAGTVIFAGVVAVWLLASLPYGVDYGSQASLIGRIGSLIAPILAPAGFGFPEAGIALISGVVAKEIVVGTLGALYGDVSLTSALAARFTPLSAYSFMLMSLIYVPCLSTLAVIRREIGTRWMLLVITWTTALGWIAAVAVYQAGSLLGGLL